MNEDHRKLEMVQKELSKNYESTIRNIVSSQLEIILNITHKETKLIKDDKNERKWRETLNEYQKFRNLNTMDGENAEEVVIFNEERLRSLNKELSNVQQKLTYTLSSLHKDYEVPLGLSLKVQKNNVLKFEFNDLPPLSTKYTIAINPDATLKTEPNVEFINDSWKKLTKNLGNQSPLKALTSNNWVVFLCESRDYLINHKDDGCIQKTKFY